MIGDGGLQFLALAQSHGVVSAAGYLDGFCYYQRSDDGGKSLLAFNDSATRSQVCPASAQQPAVAVRPDGSVLIVATEGNRLKPLLSRDGGNSWTACDVLS